MQPTPVPRQFYERDPRVVAPELLNKVLARDGRAGRIVEVEAYVGALDPASHAFGGPTPRNASMFGPPGHLYVYFSYGVHWCANAVCGAEGVGLAVLVRALAPSEGVAAMWSARPAARRERDLCSGPGKLTQALGITGADDGADLTGEVPADMGPDSSTIRPIRILDDGMAPPTRPGTGPRIGLTVAADRPWRWYVPGDANLSRRGFT